LGEAGVITLRTLSTEVSALGAATLSLPLRFVVPSQRFDPGAPHATPIVLVHGLFGDPTNFLLLRAHFAARGIRNFASFSYPPRLDYQRLARHLGRAIETVCLATGAAEVDVVGHSLGGLVARYLLEMDPEHRIRRLVTLGAPYFASPLPRQELAIFGAADPIIPPPHPVLGPHATHVIRGGRVVLVPECGHWGLLYHSTVLRESATFLSAPVELPEDARLLGAVARVMRRPAKTPYARLTVRSLLSACRITTRRLVRRVSTAVAAALVPFHPELVAARRYAHRMLDAARMLRLPGPAI
jgi:pimeloyl-ACP methyl ester carboxylesterase